MNDNKNGLPSDNQNPAPDPNRPVTPQEGLELTDAIDRLDPMMHTDPVVSPDFFSDDAQAEIEEIQEIRGDLPMPVGKAGFFDIDGKLITVRKHEVIDAEDPERNSVEYAVSVLNEPVVLNGAEIETTETYTVTIMDGRIIPSYAESHSRWSEEEDRYVLQLPEGVKDLVQAHIEGELDFEEASDKVAEITDTDEIRDLKGKTGLGDTFTRQKLDDIIELLSRLTPEHIDTTVET